MTSTALRVSLVKITSCCLDIDVIIRCSVRGGLAYCAGSGGSCVAEEVVVVGGRVLLKQEM
jgi:hypothetical protein